jgi:hypothetical protein
VTLPAPRRRPPGCPSALQLDELRAGDLAGRAEEAALRDHLAHCAACRERDGARAADPVLTPDAAMLRQASLADPARARGRRPALAVALASAAACLIVWGLAGRGGHDAAGERTKGALALTVDVKRSGGAVDEVNGEGRLQGGDEIRFTLTTARAGYAAVLGLDAAPSVTVYARPARISSAGLATLPGSVVADDTAGFERIVAVVCDAETPAEVLRRQAETALARANGHPERVTSLGTGCLERSVLFRKEPR